ncbi:hypothetical protein ENSA5_00130 [Enhygromyxa salina]|uniref:Phosphoesterase n=1 Tax=Enhygromyxa salina TaxID=215803 RepID=A0A2S9YLF9_9BACT|nr:hypothetical protein [Enhygromyxa salina]PRQ05902.1 hypothetical protein ENSA5_00130 [Enhygromyxa salina]
MRVHVLHHARCFDGAASAALFSAFMRGRHGQAIELVQIPKHHQRGDPFVDADFEGADEAAVVDFRYTQRPGLTWYFDHHRSAFQLPGDRAHFEADRSGQRFHDPAVPSCTGYLAEIAHGRFGFDASAHAELIRWAEIIDSAAFASPEAAVLYEDPAMRLAAWIQTATDPEAITAFIEALLVTPLATLAEAAWIREIVEPRLECHREDIELMRRLGRTEGGIFVYDLIDEGPRVLSHFIPYYLAPDTTYTVGIYAHPDGDLRLSAGFNPWFDPGRRTHDLAQLCERHGGGGHPFVAGASFTADEGVARVRAVQAEIVASLRAEVGA